MKIFRLFIFILTFGFIFSCDIIDDPFPPNSGISLNFGDTILIIDDSLGISDSAELRAFINANMWTEIKSPVNDKRFITLEEYTGFKCNNCPEGAEEIVRLDNKYGDQLIPIAIHAGNTFARPNVAGDKYRNDYRVLPHSAFYLTTFHRGSGYPSGIVSRIGGIVEGKENWEQSIEDIKNDPYDAVVNITNYYSSTAEVLRVNIEVNWLNSLDDSLNLQTFVIENNIIDWQKDVRVPGEDVPDYNHKYMLRKVVNDETFGRELGPAINGTTRTFQYVFPVPSNWDPDNVETVSFIFNRDVSSYEVIQANTAPIK